ncbi:peptidase M48 [Hydrogenophaga crassostreae]|uniref:Peptidase M48 n=1 Tax=Hydrogenophaga crassostreae TaxID=1763535 RepID=A0A162SUN7_9BURK|nr:M48 family metallopeptidase [Hydrogenophaga crassostreae]AOW12626.1 peptidase M48 [Hydrogenophaga crassostreae]OAD40497.1 peptidase M48 [Hydrogenophaga crassostreae]
MISPELAFSLVFCGLLIAGLVVRTVLASRQIRHVARHRGTVPEAFAQTITPEAHQKAADYTVAKTRFGLVDGAIEAALLLGWTLLGGLHWLNQGLLNLMGGGMWQQLALVGCFVLIGGALGLPTAWWSTFRIEARFGFNKMSLGLWIADAVKGAVVGALIGLPILALVLWLMGAAGPVWWLWAWGVWMGFNLLMLVFYPTLIAPLFNKFEPLQDETIKTRVNALMARCGFAASGFFVMDGSKRSAHANAYFTGFGAAKRVVFFDTLLKQLAPGEIDAVLAHELGHYKRRHIVQRVVLMFALSLVGFAMLGWLSTQSWFYTGLGVMPSLSEPNNALAILLFMMVVPLITFFLSPLMAQLSRRHEFEADAYAMEKTDGNELANALLKLYKDNASTLTPDPVYVRFYYSHPPASERIARLQGLAV